MTRKIRDKETRVLKRSRGMTRASLPCALVLHRHPWRILLVVFLCCAPRVRSDPAACGGHYCDTDTCASDMDSADFCCGDGRGYTPKNHYQFNCFKCKDSQTRAYDEFLAQWTCGDDALSPPRSSSSSPPSSSGQRRTGQTFFSACLLSAALYATHYI